MGKWQSPKRRGGGRKATGNVGRPRLFKVRVNGGQAGQCRDHSLASIQPEDRKQVVSQGR